MIPAASTNFVAPKGFLAFGFSVFAVRRVEAGVCQAEALDRVAAEDVGLNNLVDVCVGDVPIPDCVRVDHNVGAMFALIQTPGLVGAHFSFQSAFGKLLLKEFLQFGFG